MAITENEIVLPDGTKERTLLDSATSRNMEVVALTDPVTGSTVVPGSEGTLQAILAAIIAGGGGVTWPLTMDVLLVDPTPNPAKWQLYVYSDGVASPNNVQTCKLMLPNGSIVPLYSETL